MVRDGGRRMRRWSEKLETSFSFGLFDYCMAAWFRCCTSVRGSV